jgi:hypothetical protein
LEAVLVEFEVGIRYRASLEGLSVRDPQARREFKEFHSLVIFTLHFGSYDNECH